MGTPGDVRTRRRARYGRLLRRTNVAATLVSLDALRRVPVTDAGGARVGKLADVAIRWDGELDYPKVTGVIVVEGEAQVFVPAGDVARIGVAGVVLTRTEKRYSPFERRPGEVRLVADVLGRQLVDVDGVKVLRAHDLFLAPVLGRYRLVAVDGRGTLRRRSAPASGLVDWAAVQPVGEPGSTLRFRVPHEGLGRLRPGELADVLERLDDTARDQLASTLRTETVADALEEMEPKSIESFLRESSTKRAAELVAAMAPDEAVDALRDLEHPKVNEIMAQLPPEVSKRLAELLSYPEAMAGGFMTTTLVLVRPEQTVAEVRAMLADRRSDAEDIDAVAVIDEDGRLIGDVGLYALVVADASWALADLIGDAESVTVRPDAFLDEVVDALREARARSVVVVDEECRPIGRILADDVLDALKEGGLKARIPWLLR